MVQDYYELLGVSSDASESEIEEAYRERIKETHPDVSDDREASERTKQLIEARDILTDDQERKRYDRVGHDQFVNGASAGSKEESDHHRQQSSRSRRSTQQSTTGSSTQQGTTTHNSSASNGGERGSARRSRQTHGGQSQHVGPSWSKSSDESQSTGGRGQAEGTHQTWNADRSYVANEGPGMFELEHLFKSQETIVLLGTTFIIYPILLMGALFPRFPPAANLSVAFCTIMVIAYLQSVPQVGMIVFGTWSVLLPTVLFGVVGADPFTLYSILSIAAVLFPFGLSILTWLAINPSNQF